MVPQIQILTTNGAVQKSKKLISVYATGVTIPAEFANRMGLKPDDYIHLAALGTQVYISKKPEGTFGGYRAKKYSTGAKLVVGMKPGKYSVCNGQYRLGKSITQQIPNEQGNPVDITFFEMNPA